MSRRQPVPSTTAQISRLKILQLLTLTAVDSSDWCRLLWAESLEVAMELLFNVSSGWR
jgi:hypothetical protein